MIQKKKIAFAVVLLCILLNMDTFVLTTIGNQTKLMSLILSSVGFGIFIIHFRSFPKRIRQFGIVFTLLLFISIFSTYIIHDQSIKLGFLANSNNFLIGLVFLMYYVVMKYQLKLNEIKIIIIQSSWVLLFIYILLNTMDVEFISASGEDTFSVESLRKGFVTFASFIYLCDFFIKSKTKYLIFSLILFSMNQLGDFQRYIMLIYLICLILLMIQFGKKVVALKITIAILIIVPVLTLFITTTEFGNMIVQKISDTMELFDEDKKHFSDSSIEARVWQTEAAFKSIEQYPIFGIGNFHNTETKRITGLSYFYISDIGLIGVMFSFGTFGILIFILQIIYLIQEFRTKGVNGKVQFLYAKYYILFILLHTIITGRSIIMPEEFMTIMLFIEIGKVRLSNNFKRIA